jgi:hypothetical protein
MLNVPNMIGISISPKLNRLANARLVEGAAQNSAQQRNATTQKDGSWSYLTSSHIYIYINMVIYIYGYLYIYISVVVTSLIHVWVGSCYISYRNL